MRKIFLVQAAAIFILFSTVVMPFAPTIALATNTCDAGLGKPGFKVGGRTLGSVVTLCAKYVADHTAGHSIAPLANGAGMGQDHHAFKPKHSKSIAEPLDVKAKLRLLHRRLAMAANNSFSPNPLIIRSSMGTAKLRQPVIISVAHNRQFRLAYLLSRFVALRFTPIKIDFHVDAKARQKYSFTRPFSSSVRFFSTGFHTIRALVTYRAEFRVNGSKLWQNVPGEPVLAALPTRVLVIQKPAHPRDPEPTTKRSYLVADDCLSQLENIGCLN